jgi:hypothetical protein
MPTDEEVQHCAAITQKLTDVIGERDQVAVIRKDGTQVLGRLAASTHPTSITPASGNVTVETSYGTVAINFLDIQSIDRMSPKSK